MSILPKDVSQKLDQAMLENIYNYDDTYKKMFNDVIYNFYWDIFQNRKMCSKIFSWEVKVPNYNGNGYCNMIAEGARSMEKIYIEKNNKDYASHIDASLWVA